MPVISFANPKGGSGKTTTALLLATQLAEKGATVAVLDADPEKWISQWSKLPGKPDNVTVIDEITDDTIVELIQQAALKHQFVIVDLEGTATVTVAYSVGMSDLVIIPTQGASMDARGSVKTLKLIKSQESIAGRSIPYGVVRTRTSAAITSRSLRNVEQQLSDHGINMFKTSIVDRAAYRDLFDFGGGLADLDPSQVRNLEKARENAAEFTLEVLAMLKSSMPAQKAS